MIILSQGREGYERIYSAFDTRTEATTLLNTGASGNAGNGTITEVRALSGGTSVVFVSTSSNLVPGDINGVADVFLKNLKTGAVTLLSKSASGAQANGASGSLDVSADGSRIVFSSTATNLTSTETAGFENVYVKNIATGAVTLVSATASGTAGSGDSTAGVFSPDGRSVAFQSTAFNLVANDTNGRQDVFLKSLDSGAVTSLSFVKEGGSAIEVPVTDKPAFSADGGIVTFGNSSYAVDDAGFLILDVTSWSSAQSVDGLSVSQGDGTAPTLYEDVFYEYRNDPITVTLDYDRDGDFRATLTGLKDATPGEESESFLVKVRAHSGAQNFIGDGTGELVLLSSSNDKADGAGGDDTLYGFRGADDLSGGAGNDVLDGGLGNDILRGGLGDDIYYIDNASDRIVEAAGAGRDTALASFSATLAANVEELRLTGTAALSGTGNALGNTITGNEAANTLYGLDGDDVLDGGDGADRLVGGAGNDRYIVRSDDDAIVEQAGGGTDTVVSSLNWTLTDNIENLILSDNPDRWHDNGRLGTGNALANVLTGNSFGNTLTGLDGDDTLIGGGGSDRLVGGNGTDRLEGGLGYDALDGGRGADVMLGGADDDRYRVTDAGDRVVEIAGEGIDTVVTTIDWSLERGSSVEELVADDALGRSFKLVGNEFQNRIFGSFRDDVLDGGAGADTLLGGAGNDTYLVDDSGDVVVDDATVDSGADVVIASTSFGLNPEARIETLKFADNRSTAALSLIGSSIGQTLIGNGGASRLNGRGGDDTYIVDNGADLVFEAVGQGNDTVVTSGSYTLAAGQEIETLKLAGPTGTAARGLKGNGFANTLIGNAGANGLDGDGGADSLYGLAGNDTYTIDNVGDRVFERAGEGTDTLRTSVSYVLAAGQEVEVLQLVGTASINLTGNDLSNTLLDNAGNNRLDGGGGIDLIRSTGGIDTLIGGAGDTAVIDRSGATAALSFVMTSVEGTTTLVGDGTTTTGIGNITLFGGSGNDRFVTLAGNNRLNGEAGNDTLTGGAGFDILAGGAGNDTLKAGAGNDTLTGGEGNDTLEGGAGRDTLDGGAGDDLYLVDSSTDQVFEMARGGSDRIFSTSNYALAGGQEIESLSLLGSTGTARLNLSGNEFGQALVGNAGANGLEGKGGNDVLTGGKGADSFVFASTLGANNVDRITDFSAEDTIRLSKSVFTALAPGELKASEFKDIAKGKVDADDHILYDSRTGSLFYDADGSGRGAAVKFAVLDNKVALTHADFVV
ncbi:hypothetical protein [Methylorubrum sp. SB2]|uniref:hypothetical protein n=1 Tax=Methylorubrum subtropicum TaxID=3138812 RepID=UPI00313D2974